MNNVKIRTSKKQYAWTVMRKVGGRWRTIVDGMGIITMPTRKIARDISREFQNMNPKTRRNFRVAKFQIKQ
jgi:hypothetical protein